MSTNGIGGASDLPALLTINDMAKLLRCSIRTVARMRRDGHVPSPLKIGGALRWRVDVVKAWIDQGCNPNPSREAPQGSAS